MSLLPLSVNLDMSDPEAIRIERHGYVNLVNVVHAELQLIERLIEAPGVLRSTIRLCETAVDAFRDDRVAHRSVHDLEIFSRVVTEDIRNVLNDAGDTAESDDVRDVVSIVTEVLDDVDLRVQETLAMHGVERPAEVRTIDSVRDELIGDDDGTVVVETISDADEIEIPYRAPRVIGRLIRELRQSTDTSQPAHVVLDRSPETLRISIDAIDTDPLLPLTQHIRPGTLMADRTVDQTMIRGALLAWYLVRPAGSITLARDPDGRRALIVTIPQTDGK
jgi:hypothetical protein